MFRTLSIRSLSLAAVGAIAIGSAPALAQQVQQRVDDRIVVTAPTSVDIERDRYQLGAAESASVTRIVDTYGLDLRYEADVDELHRRVAYAAQLACDEAEALIEDSLTLDHECEREARRDAAGQVQAAIEQDRYWRR